MELIPPLTPDLLGPPALFWSEGSEGLLSETSETGEITGAQLRAISRHFLQEEGRLTPEQLRAQLADRGVIAELERENLWKGDGPRQREAQRHGFTFGDLWSFYGWCASSRAQAAEKLRLNSEEVRNAAVAIRAGAAALRRTREAFQPPWCMDQVSEPGDQLPRSGHALTIVGNIDDARYPDATPIEVELLRHADELERHAESLPANRRATPSQRSFIIRWDALATERRCDHDLRDVVGAQLFNIVYGKVNGKDLTAEAFAARLKREHKRRTKAPSK